MKAKGDKMRNLFLFVIIIILLTACATQDTLRGELIQSVKQYNDMLRWHKLDTAGIFAIDSLSEEFRTRVEAAKNINVVDYRIIGVKYDETKNEAEVRVEIDYYNISSNTLKNLKDNQKWAYVEEAGSKQWRLKSLLPEFK